MYFSGIKNGSFSVRQASRGEIMFRINDVIVYSLHGICRITEIEEKEFGGEKQLYYTLTPLFDERSTFFVPVENDFTRKKLKEPLSEREIKKIFREASKIKPLSLGADTRRKDSYQKIIENGDRQEIMALLKMLYERRRYQSETGKKQHLIDERYMKRAEDTLAEEFAFICNTDKNEIIRELRSKLDK